MSGKDKRNGGFLLAEMSVSMAVLGLLVISLALSMDIFRRFNDYQLARQRCISAGQAEIESIAATGKTISDEDFKRLWPRLNVSIEKTEGAGLWEGMTLVAVTTNVKSFDKEVKIQLSRYISRGER